MDAGTDQRIADIIIMAAAASIIAIIEFLSPPPSPRALEIPMIFCAAVRGMVSHRI